MEGDNGRGVRGRKKIAILPWELIIEILLRLPVKALVRFKCVCKSWLRLLSDPHFATSHFEQPSTRTHRLIFIIAPSSPQIRSIDFNASLHDDSASAALNLNFLRPNTYLNVQIIGSCRGFLLLNGCQSIWAWNPSTGVYKKLSSAPIGSNLMRSVFYTFLYGFGYDSSTDDYLVVKASYSPISRYNATTRFEFLSLRTNAWTDIEAFHLSYMNSSQGIGVGLFLNGAIHWLAFCCDVSMDVVVAFDLTKRSFSEIPLPVDFSKDNDLDSCKMGVLGELLSISAVGWNHSVEIWVMKEYKVQSSWTKTIVVSSENILFFPVCSTKGGDIVGTYGSTGLAKCNDEGQVQEHRSYSNHPYPSQLTVYTESLLSLPM